MISIQKLKILGSSFFSLIISFIVFLPVLAGIIGVMIIFVGANYVLVYSFWNILAELFELLNLDQHQSIFYFQGHLKVANNIDSIVLFISLILILIGFLLFSIGVVQISLAKKNKKDLINTYLYNYLRHPQIAGIILMSIGIFLYVPTTWPDLTYTGDTNYWIRIGDLYSLYLFIIIWIIEAFYEERMLLSEYEQLYQDYKEQTPFIIPFSKRLTEFLTNLQPLTGKNIPFSMKVLFVIFLYVLSIVFFSSMVSPSLYLTR